MRVLVTGGTGFIGGAIARALIARGDTVVVLARSAGRAGAVEAAGASIALGDVRDAGTVARAAAGCEVVVHAAGVPRPASWRTFRSVHVDGTRSVVEGARDAGVRRVVNLASQAVMFGGVDLLNMNESDPYPARFIDPYSATKAAAERGALAESGRGIEVVSLRPALVWGRGDTTVLPIMAKLSRSRLGVPMCGDGSNFEATTHIVNLVGAVMLAMSAPGAAGRAYLVGDPFRVTWKGFLTAMIEAAGVGAKFRRIPRAIALPAAWALDQGAGALGLPVPLARFGVRTSLTSRIITSTRARDELGYAPRVGLDDGLSDLRVWVREVGGASALIAGGAAGSHQP